jgi:hypothetical protein
MDQDHKITWNSHLEKIMTDEGERSLCFSWLHLKSENYYSKLNTYLSIPVIMLSTIAGAGSFGSQSLFNGSSSASLVIGSISLTVATLNTIGSYFSWAKRSESHRIAAATYKKVYRFILIELALPRDERISAKDMLKIVREQCDRLQETSPQIPDNIIADFKVKFGTTTPDVAKPEITNGLDPIMVHSPHSMSPKISISDHIPDKLQKLSLVHQQIESASGNNHT